MINDVRFTFRIEVFILVNKPTMKFIIFLK